MRRLVGSFETEHARYKLTADRAIAQIRDAELGVRFGPEANSIAIICRHVAGNLASKFTDFLSSDGDKPWRNRDSEFDAREESRAEVLACWENGWGILFQTLTNLNDRDLLRLVETGGRPYLAHEALCRSLTHTSYHIGQIVILARQFRGVEWENLSIPRSTENRRDATYPNSGGQQDALPRAGDFIPPWGG